MQCQASCLCAAGPNLVGWPIPWFAGGWWDEESRWVSRGQMVRCAWIAAVLRARPRGARGG